MAERPILALPKPTKAKPKAGKQQREPVKGLSPARQGARLGPKFDRLSETLSEPGRLAELRDDPAAIVPERALVLEIAGTLTDFYRAVRSIGLELVGEEEEEVEADADFSITEKPDALVPTRLYFTIPDERALRELVSLWQRFQKGQPLGEGRAAWRQVFEHLKDIRPWGAKDRLTAEAVADWRERLETAPARPVRFEVEFWFRDGAERRQRTENSFRAMVGGLGGQIIHQATIAPIRYHAALAEVPPAVIRNVLDHPDIGIVAVDEVMVLRPQSVVGDRREPDEENREAAPAKVRPAVLRPPVAALLDGFPMTGHDLLQGWLVVDDPDDFEAQYGSAAEQRHGTAMASLIVHGDLDIPHEPIQHQVYVRPVTYPQETLPGDRDELMPADRLGIDLVWLAFQRMLAGENGAPASAPSVRVVNLSLGDAKRRFAGLMSPWAKLVDYISWTHKILVLVSAGNILDPLPLPGVARWQDFEGATPPDREKVLLQSIIQNRATRRLLSPSEAVNALTIGACHAEGLAGKGTGAMAVPAYESASLPNPSSALGQGFRRGIKPELLFPGGREQVRSNSNHAPIEVRPAGSPSRYYGVRAASPGNRGATAETERSSGTSVATALGTHDAIRVIEALQDLPQDEVHPALDDRFTSVIVKALMVHAARWEPATAELLKTITNPQGAMHWAHEREELTRILGYGRPDMERVLDCARERATLIGWGSLQADEADQFRVPLPPGLEGIKGFRSVTLTVAWLTPLNLGHRMYRMAKLNAFPGSDKAFSLGVERGNNQPSQNAIERGTIFHISLEGTKAAPFVDNGDLVFTVGCKAIAGDLDVDIPYGVALSIEVGQDVAVPVYEQVLNRLRAAVKVPV